jgi:septum site-determining protein MinC
MMKSNAQSLDIKSTQLPSLVLWIKSKDIDAFEHELKERVEQAPAFFNDEPVILDISALSNEKETLPFDQWLSVCRAHRMVPVGCRGGEEQQSTLAQSLGLALLPEGTKALESPIVKEVQVEVVKEVKIEIPVEVQVPTRVPTKILDRHLRSGQQFYAQNTDLIVLAPIAAGAEVIADGNIHVYSPLRGKAIAGAKGDRSARIFTSSLEAELVSIAGVYRILELSDQKELWHGKTACISLGEEQRLHIQPLSA